MKIQVCWLHCLKKKFGFYLLLLELGSVTWVGGATWSPSTGVDRTRGWPWPVPAGQSVLCAWVEVWAARHSPLMGQGAAAYYVGWILVSTCELSWGQKETSSLGPLCGARKCFHLLVNTILEERRLQCASGQIIWQKTGFGRRTWREGPDHTPRSGASLCRNKLAKVRSVRAAVQSTLQSASFRPRCPSWDLCSGAGYQDLIREAVHPNSPSDASVNSLKMILWIYLSSLNTGSKLNKRLWSRL